MQIKDKITKALKKSKFILHETKKRVLIKFMILLLILLAYFTFVSIKYGLSNGFMVTILTWSFFVFCTPIADAGFLLDFPIRLLTKVRMVYSESVVWIIAFLLNLFTYIFNPAIYEKTPLLMLFKHILETPIPFWAIIILSGVGTFLSVYFGDELIDVAKHKHRKKYAKHKKIYRIIVVMFVIVAIILMYIYLIRMLGLNISIF